MSNLKEFIEVTSIYDGRKAAIRASCIDSVIDNAAEKQDFGMKPECRRINYSGGYLDVSESYEEICGMIYSAEL